MQFSKAFHDLNEDTPNLLLTNAGALFLVFDNLMAKITLIRILHNDALLVAIYHKDFIDSSINASLYEIMFG